MCFSTQASLTAAVLLGAIGTATLKITTLRNYFCLAAIPILFSIQQLSKGILWFHLEKHAFSATTGVAAQYMYLFFAFIVWPIWIPLSLLLVEKTSWRRNVMYGVLTCGICLSILFVWSGLKWDPGVEIVHHSLQYAGNAPIIAESTYPLIVLIPCFISSLRHMKIIGTLFTLTYFAAYYFYHATYVSVWCFFAAIVSLGVYKIIKDNQYQEKSQIS